MLTGTRSLGRRVLALGNRISRNLPTPGEVLKNYREAKASLQGQATSRATRIRTLLEILGVKQFKALQAERAGHRPEPTKILLRLGGKPYVYFTDGSLRHALGAKPGKKARKALKRARRAQAARST